MSSSRPLRRFAVLLAFVACVSAGLLAPAAARASGGLDSILALRGHRTATADGVRWSDVPKRYWARAAIDYVGGANDWMRDFTSSPDGTYPFQPTAIETRALFARAIVLAFAPAEAADSSIAFNDVPADDPFYPYVNVAVRLGWMRATGGAFRPSAAVTTTSVHHALVLALGLSSDAAALDTLSTRNGHTFDTPPDFGTLLIGMRLGLRYNHADDSLDVGPTTPLPRSEVAWSLYRAATTPTWAASSLSRYASVVLPSLGPKMQRVVQFGISYTGYPYVYGGEWGGPSPSGYCCGEQPVGGFDCSGLVWWVLRASDETYAPPRPYGGWPLPERSSRDMAAAGASIQFEDIKVGDLLFYDGTSDGIVDHVNLYLGNGWALDSSNGYGGVTILSVASGWYHDHFVGARRIASPAPVAS